METEKKDNTATAALIEAQAPVLQAVLEEMRKTIVGQDYLLKRLLISLLCSQHVLIEGVPGLAKTLSVNTLSKTIDTECGRVQFTPDLLPSDLLGTMIYHPGSGEFSPKKGPVFTNILLADEINRAPAKVQSALLEAMQERQVTMGDTRFDLPELFLVMATQNPIEQEGTYPLPEAQVDRFMMKLKIGYPTRDEELEILRRMAKSGGTVATEARATEEQMLAVRDLVDEIYISPALEEYIVDLVQATRTPDKYGLENGHLIEYGASPRATIFLTLAAKAWALLESREYVTPGDIREIGPDVLRHRVIVSYEAEAEEIDSDAVIASIFDKLPVP